MTKKIGLIGEDPNDTEAIQNLLLQKLHGKVTFLKLLKNKRGYQLNNNRTLESLKIEYKSKCPDVVIFIRDTDGIYTEQNKINKTKEWYNLLSKEVRQSILLLNIYELESLILADLTTFNQIFGTNLNNKKNVHYIKEPKEFLIQKTSANKKKYKESDCPELFKKLNIETIASNSDIFTKFLNELSLILKIKLLEKRV